MPALVCRELTRSSIHAPPRVRLGAQSVAHRACKAPVLSPIPGGFLRGHGEEVRSLIRGARKTRFEIIDDIVIVRRRGDTA
ncbi:MAG TPA: hypothetical protein VNJ04_05440 [Gemmatimonadaceae bacterium]|nr:hypothetical protein [Gemmatimonadaceae bacterium]